MKRKQHQLDNDAGFASLLLICAIVIIVFVGLGVYYLQKQASHGEIATPSVAPSKASSPSTMPSVNSIISVPLDLKPIAASLEPPPLLLYIIGNNTITSGLLQSSYARSISSSFVKTLEVRH